MRSLLKLAGRAALSNIAELAHPYKLTFIVTNRCQLRCAMCNIWQKKGAAELSGDEIDEFFRRSNRFSWVNLSGGEIFLRSDILDIIGSIRRHCRDVYLVNFPTNGYEPDLVAGAVARIIREYPFPKLLVTVSLDGPPAIHDRIRAQAGSWEKAVDTFSRLRRMRSRSFNVFLGMTLQQANFNRFNETLASVRERLSDVRPGEFHVNVAHRSGHYYGNLHFTGDQDRQHLWKELARITKLRAVEPLNPVAFLERRYQHLAGRFLTSKITPVPCQALSASVFLDPAGVLYPCSVFDRPLGNIKNLDFDLAAFWKSAERMEARKEIRDSRCPQCWTPCEAYQSILAALIPLRQGRVRNRHD